MENENEKNVTSDLNQNVGITDIPTNNVTGEGVAPTNNVNTNTAENATPNLTVDSSAMNQGNEPIQTQNNPTLSTPYMTDNQLLESTNVINVVPNPDNIGSTANPNEVSLSTENNDVPKEKKKKSKLGVVIILLLFILLIGGGVFAYFNFFALSPEKIFTKIFEAYQNSANNTLNLVTGDGDFLEEGNISVETNIKSLSDINNTTIDYNYGLNKEDKVMGGVVTLNENNKKVIDCNVYLQEDGVYVKSEKILQNPLFYALPINFETLFNNIDTSKIRLLMTKLNNSIKLSLPSAKYSSNMTNVSINGKSTKAVKNTMNINSLFVDNIINKLSVDAEVNSILNDIFGINDITEISDSIKESISDANISINAYTKFLSGEVLKYEILSDGNVVFSAVKVNNNKYNVIISLNDSTPLEFSITIANNIYTIEYASDSFNLTATINSIKNNNSLTLNTTFNFSFQDENYLTFKFNQNIDYTKKIDKINITDAKNVESLSSSEMQNITFKASKILQSTNLYRVLEKLSPAFSRVYIPEDPIEYDTPTNTTTNTTVNETTNETTNTTVNETTNETAEIPEEVPEACSYESIQCSNCNGTTCTCTYIDNTFKTQTITCPDK